MRSRHEREKGGVGEWARRLCRPSAPPLFHPSTLLLAAGCWLLAALPLPAADDLAARQATVQSLSLSEQQQLLRNQERFGELPAEEQDRLRKLHDELSRDPNAAKLKDVLERYHEWLKTLSPEQRAELVELAADERIERIKQIMSRQHEERDKQRRKFAGGGQPLPPEDQQAIFRWYSDYVWRNRDEIMARIPQGRREEFERLDEATRRRRLMFITLQSWRNGPPPVRPEDLERLLQSLSPETRDRMAKADPQQRKWLAKEFFMQAVAARMEPASTRRALAMVSSEDLERFFQNELRAEDRQRLMNLPRDQMREELRHLYLQQTRRPDGPPRDRPEGRPFGPPDGREFRPRPPEDRLDGPEGNRPEFPPKFRGPKRPPGERGGNKRERPPAEGPG